jgi:hypothetical protein
LRLSGPGPITTIYCFDACQIAASFHDSPHTNSQFKGISVDEDYEEDCSPFDASKQDVLNAYSFVALNLEQPPITTLDDLLYYRYGFSLNEEPYNGIPASVDAKTRSLHSWTQVCRAVGGQDFVT